MSGTVNIARSIFDHEVFRDEPMTEREAWIWLIMEASWKPRKKRAGDKVVDLERGQLAASVRFMAAAWKWTPAKVQRFIKRLHDLKMICAKTDTGVTVVSICNYDEYQSKAQASDTGAIQQRYSSDTNENKGEIREEGYSEANASDASVDPAKAVFDAGVKVLASAGLTERSSRAFLGKLRKDFHGRDGEILTAIMDCGRAGAVDPIPWITARLRPRQPASFFDLSKFGMTQ